MGDGFYRSKDPTNSIEVLKEKSYASYVMAALRVVYTVKVWSSGGASYGAKELTPLQFLLQPLQNFCVKQYNVSRSMFVRTKIQIAATGCHIF